MSVGLRATGDSDLLSCLRASRASLRSNEDTGSRMKQNERPGMWLRARVGGGGVGGQDTACAVLLPV